MWNSGRTFKLSKSVKAQVEIPNNSVQITLPNNLSEVPSSLGKVLTPSLLNNTEFRWKLLWKKDRHRSMSCLALQIVCVQNLFQARQKLGLTQLTAHYYTFLFLWLSTWKGCICFFSASQATASASRTHDFTESFFTLGILAIISGYFVVLFSEFLLYMCILPSSNIWILKKMKNIYLELLIEIINYNYWVI